MNRINRRIRSFTLVEILVVVSIIGLLAGLAIPAVGGALAAARRAKVASMAQQIRTALVQFHTEYGYFPTNGMSAQYNGPTGPLLAQILTADTNNATAMQWNPRRIPFLEVPKDFTRNASGDPAQGGIVTPLKFYAGGQSNFFVAVDGDYDGVVVATNNQNRTNLRATTAVWFIDPRSPTKTIGTW